MTFELNKKISVIFLDIADALELLNENFFKVRSYRNAADTINSLDVSLYELYKQNKLSYVKGIGKNLESKIKEFIETGTIKFYNELLDKVPYMIFKLKNISGLGPKTLYKFYKHYHVRSLDNIKKLVFNNDELEDIGLRKRSIERIRSGIEIYEKNMGLFPSGSVFDIALSIVTHLKTLKETDNVSIAGSLRRGKETVGNLNIVASSDKPSILINALLNMDIKQTLSKENTKVNVILGNNLQVDFRVVNTCSFGSAQLYFTGSKKHNIKLRNIAARKSLKLNEYGLFEGSKIIAQSNEHEIYKALNMDYIPPTLREDKGEIEAAIEYKLPNIVNLKDIKGDLHMHTNFSDGNLNLEDAIIEGIKRNYEYIAITDHSISSYVAHGLSIERLYNQLEKIDILQEKYKSKIHILKGAEVDIKNDGTLDYPDNVLKDLDIIIVSIHQGLMQSKDTLTKRIIDALSNPYSHILAHPTSRIIGQRNAYDVDIDKILEIAHKYHKILEINSYYLRLDLNDENAKRAKSARVKIAINSDAHSKENFDYIKYGILTAQRGWLEKQDIVNTYKYDALMKYIKQ